VQGVLGCYVSAEIGCAPQPDPRVVATGQVTLAPLGQTERDRHYRHYG
jgi:hypothetical protein